MATQYIYSNSFSVTKTTSGGNTPVTSVTLNKSTLNLIVGNNETLVATIAPANATNKSVTWSSGSTNIATVDSNGKVTAVASGSAVITVRTADGGYTATCGAVISSSTVSVTGVSLNKSTLNLNVGNTETLVATVSPSNATNKDVTWSSSNSSVASVSSNGLVTCNATGSCTITVRTNDGNYTATCNLTVSSSGGGTGILYDVFLVAGQSNMVGWNAPKDPTLDAGIPEVLQFNSYGSLVQAEFPLDFQDDNAEWVNSFKNRSGGLHIHFAKKYVQAGKLASGRKVVLIPSGKGGTSFLGGHWTPSGSLYQDTVNRINAFKSAYSGKYEFKGILWHQGESDWELMNRTGTDAEIQTQCNTYCASLKTALTGFRTAMGSTVPVVMGGFADEWVATRTKVGTIFEPTLQNMCATETKMAYASSDGLPSNLPVDGGSGGVVHFSASAQRTFGERYYNAYATIEGSSGGGGTVSVTGVSLNKSTTSISSGSTEQLIATVLPSNASNKSVTWTSSNTGVATVSSSGLVTGVSTGSCTITVRTVDGNYSATCNTTITSSGGGANVPVTGVSLNYYNATVQNGGTFQLIATVAPPNATNKSVAWSTLNDQFLSVDSNGLVRGLQVGTGKKIRVTTVDGNFSVDCAFEITAGSGGGGTNSIVLDKTSISLIEEQQGTIGVKLSSQPSGNVTVNVARAYNNIDALPNTLTFTTSNWSSYQYVTIHTWVDANTYPDYDIVTFSAIGCASVTCNIEVKEKGSSGGTEPPVTSDGNPIEQQYSSSHEATPNNPSPPSGAYNWVDKPRINPDGSFPQSTWNAIGHWITTYKVAGQNYFDNVGLLLQNPVAWIWNTSTQTWDVISDNFEWGTWYREDFWNDGNGDIANTVIWENGVGGNNSKWVKIKQTSETSGRCFHPWGYQKNWRSNANWSNNGQPYIVTKVDFKLVKWDETGADNLANAKLVVNSGADWWRNVGDTWQPDWSTNRDMAVGKYLLATTTLRRAYCTNLPQNWSKGFPTD